MSATVAIHQPNYFPWLGYFLKIHLADTFVFLDDVEFSKNSYTKRTKIVQKNKHRPVCYLSVPINKSSDFNAINTLTISDHGNWHKKHLNKIFNSYHSEPYYEAYHDQVEKWINLYQPGAFLSEINARVIIEICNLIGLNTAFKRSSSLPSMSNSSNHNSRILNALHASIYLSGMGGKNYLSDPFINNSSFKVRFIDSFHYFEKHPYQNLGFHNGLSILDALFTVGAKSIYELLDNYYINYYDVNN